MNDSYAVFEGRVIHGDGRGRVLGFPTANLAVSGQVLESIERGVYAGTATWGEECHRLAVLNVGVKPTFGDAEVTVEAHILDFSGDLYGVTLRIHLAKRLRSERRFADADALIQQLNRDVECARLAVASGSTQL